MDVKHVNLSLTKDTEFMIHKEQISYKELSGIQETKRAVVRNRDGDARPQMAVFDIRGARQKAGNWMTTIKKVTDLRKATCSGFV